MTPVDEVDWAGLRATDVPGLLREACSDDPAVAAAAVARLRDRLLDRDTAEPAAAAAAPLLAVAAKQAAHRRDRMVLLLGQLADPARPAAHEAVLRHGRLFVTLLNDHDARMREAAAFAAARVGAPAEPLWWRWAIERDTRVRASLALALGAVDAVAARPRLAEAARHAAPEVRAAAALALLRAGFDLPATAVASVTEAIDGGARLPSWWLGGALPARAEPALAELGRWLMDAHR